MAELSNQIETPSSLQMERLCNELASQADTLSSTSDWPKRQLQSCARDGVFRWFVPVEMGGLGWSPNQIVDGYLKLGAVCLTTTFVITQWAAAVKRMVISTNQSFATTRARLLPGLLRGETHITVGISHLTTSRRYLGKPALRARQTDDGFELDGFSPWVTGAPFADHYLIGATLENEDQVLLVVASDSNGIEIKPSQSLVALSASRTGAVLFDKVKVPQANLVAGPGPAVLASKGNAGTGGLQTSALALALSRAAIDFIFDQAGQRSELGEKAEVLDRQWQTIRDDLFQMAEGQPVCSNEELRARANSLVLRSTQAALVAAKGAGYVEGHPVGRWCREALFFLVWSCPQTVLDANLCELAGIES